MSHPRSSGVYTVWGCVKPQKMDISATSRVKNPEKLTSQVLMFTVTPLSALIPEQMATRHWRQHGRSNLMGMEMLLHPHGDKPNDTMLGHAYLLSGMYPRKRDVGRSLGLLKEVIDELRREKVL